AEVLVERDVNRVEQSSDLAQRPAVERPALPEARSVEVQRDGVLARPPRLRAQVAPQGQLPAEVALRQLEEQRTERFVYGVQIRPRHEAVALADRARLQAVQMRVAAFLVDVEVALRMEPDREAAASLAQNPERDLLRHRAAREDRRRFLAEQFGNAGLEALHALAATVDVQAR